MTPLWTATEIAAATGGTASADFPVSGVAYDSREVGPGDLFVALTGESTDGHRFVPQAIAQGAAGVIVSAPCDAPHIRVADTTAALNALAAAASVAGGENYANGVGGAYAIMASRIANRVAEMAESITFVER